MIDTAANQWPSETAADRALLAKLLIASALLHIRVRHQTVIDTMTERACNFLTSFDDRGEMGLWKVMAGALRRRPGRVQPAAEELIRAGLADLEAANHLWGIGYALYELGMLQHMQVRYAEARETLNRSLYYFEKVGQPWAITLVLDMLAENMQTLGNYVAARDYMARQIEPLRDLGMLSQVQRVEVAVAWLSQRGSLAPSMSLLLEGLEDLQAAGDRRGAAWAIYNLAWVHLFERNFAEAERLFHDCLRTFIALGDDAGIVWSNIFLATVALEDGRRAGVEPYVDGARRALAEIDFPWGVSGLDYLLGDIALHDGDLPGAMACYRRAVEVAAGAQSVMQVLRHISGIADIWLLDERPEDALAMATYLHEHPTTWDDTRRRTRQLIEKIQELLPPDEVAKAQTTGRAFTLELAIEKALRSSD
jgi:tetratricopeptide (TPR) repeat protein